MNLIKIVQTRLTSFMNDINISFENILDLLELYCKNPYLDMSIIFLLIYLSHDKFLPKYG